MKSGIAIVELYERKLKAMKIPCVTERNYLIDLIEAGLSEAYEEGKQEMLRMAKQHAKRTSN